MASSSSVTNDELKLRIRKVYAQFVSDVDSDRLSDWLVQENVITIDQWQRIRSENPAKPDRCRALLNHLFSIQHPRAFLVVREALSKENHYILESIDSKKPSSGIRIRPEIKTVLQGLLKKEEDLKQRVHQLESELQLEKNKVQQLEKYNECQKREWEAEKDRLLKMQNELETKLHQDKIKLQKLMNYPKDQKRTWDQERDGLLKMQQELEIKLHLSETKRNPKEDSQSTELRAAQMQIRNLRAKIQELEKNSKLNNSANVQPTERWKNLARQSFQMEAESRSESLRTDYKSDPVLVQTITTRASKMGREINGLAILDRELFVVNKENSEVEVYDLIKFNFSHQWSLKELNDPFDIGSCNRNKCLYISDYKGRLGYTNAIFRVDPNGNLIKKWLTGYDHGCLSVTDESNVILSVSDGNKISEYSPDGQLIREINILCDAAKVIISHAIKLTNGHFMISHRYGSFCGIGQQRVSLVNEQGKLKKSIGGECESALDDLFYLSVDGNGFVLVADRDKRRVLLFDSDLEFKGEILSKEKHGLRGPSRILLDESNGRLIVADNNMIHRDGHILIFDLK